MPAASRVPLYRAPGPPSGWVQPPGWRSTEVHRCSTARPRRRAGSQFPGDRGARVGGIGAVPAGANGGRRGTGAPASRCRPQQGHRDHPRVQVPALWPPVGALDPGRDDVRVARRDDALGPQPVQAGAHRPLRQPGCSRPAWPPTGTRLLRPARCGLARPASTNLHALDGWPPRSAGTGARLRAQEITSTLTSHRPKDARPCHPRASRWAQFGLIHPRPEPFTGERVPPLCPG
jgi:hypothetical protein